MFEVETAARHGHGRTDEERMLQGDLRIIVRIREGLFTKDVCTDNDANARCGGWQIGPSATPEPDAGERLKWNFVTVPSRVGGSEERTK